jgi:hypothetical protein
MITRSTHMSVFIAGTAFPPAQFITIHRPWWQAC